MLDHSPYSVDIIELGDRLQDHFGLTIREHPHFDVVDDVHSTNSYHYTGEAIDVQDWREDHLEGVHWTERTRHLKDLLTGIGAEVYGPGDPGHDTHVHLAADQGIFHFNACQFHIIFCSDVDGQRFTFSGQDQRRALRDQFSHLPTC
jgi:hypothetical protein